MSMNLESATLVLQDDGLALPPADQFLTEGAIQKEILFDANNFYLSDGRTKSRGMLLRELRKSYCIAENGRIYALSDLAALPLTEPNLRLVGGIRRIDEETLGNMLTPRVSRQTIRQWENGIDLNQMCCYYAQLSRIFCIPVSVLHRFTGAPKKLEKAPKAFWPTIPTIFPVMWYPKTATALTLATLLQPF